MIGHPECVRKYKLAHGLLALALSGPALAQDGQMLVEMPWSTVLTVQGSVTPLAAGSAVIPGQTQSVDLKTNPILATFPGLITGPMTVVAIRLAIASSAGWKATTRVDVPLPAPVVVPAGRSLSITLAYGITGGAGVLQWKIPTNVVSGPIVSPDGTKMPPAVQIIDGKGSVWTLTPPIGPTVGTQYGVQRVNGTSTKQTSDSVDYVTIKNGIVYEFDAGWEIWDEASQTFLSTPTAPF